jgi:hypothetical protein
LSSFQQQQLQSLVDLHGLSFALGDLQLLEGKWYVTHSGLLHLALKNRCSGIHTEAILEFCDPVSKRWVVKATVFKTPRSKGFVGYGDADPTNVSALVRGAEMRVAETRAVNRALRKAYGIGMCSVEEVGSADGPPPQSAPDNKIRVTTESPNGHRLRDRLCLLIRQFQLDGGQVKRYAAAFCGTQVLRQASREQVEKFVNHLVDVAQHGREKLLEQLAPYAAEAVTEGSNKEAA